MSLRYHGGAADTEQESALKVHSEEEIFSAAPVGIRTRNLSITSPALLPTSYTGSLYLQEAQSAGMLSFVLLPLSLVFR